MDLKIETLPPLVSVTVTTLDILAQQENYADVLALYMAYVQITTWQNNASIYASKSFMMKRLKWGEDRIIKARTALRSLGLIEDRQHRGEHGQVGRNYTLVKHIITATGFDGVAAATGFDGVPVLRGTSANDKQLSANDAQTLSSLRDETPPREAGAGSPPTAAPKASADHVRVLAEALGRQVPRNPTPLILKLNTRLKNFTFDEIVAAAKAIGADPFMTGDNDGNKKYNTLEYLLRNDSKLQEWVDRAEEKKPRPQLTAAPQEVDWSGQDAPLDGAE